MPARYLVALVRRVVAEARAGAGDEGPRLDAIVDEVERQVSQEWFQGPRKVINATGTILHTNLGRAPLSRDAMEATIQASRYASLEHDLISGRRVSRQRHVENLNNVLLGAQASMMVTNNAAAILLALAATTSRKEVIVSRGQAVEIGEGFRLPAIVKQSRARMVEVGTTNRTTIQDYTEAVTTRTAAFLFIHTSNFRVVGFTHEVAIAELVEEARERGLLVLVDNGSGALIDTTRFGLAHEPMPEEAIAAGADVVTFSTDKLLGGPQGGIIAGRRAALDRIRGHPLARALRPDKMAVAALHATLAHYLSGDILQIPVLTMLNQSPASLAARARRVVAEIGPSTMRLEVEEGESTVGGGSLPGQTLPTTLIAIRSAAAANELATRMRALPVPVIPRIQAGRVLLDLRTVPREEDGILVSALRSVVADGRRQVTPRDGT